MNHTKINYQVTLLSDLHTGGDGKNGTHTPCRKQKKLIKPEKIVSVFNTKTEQRTLLMLFLLEVYKSIDKRLKIKYAGYYEPFKGNLLAAAAQPTKAMFIECLLTKCGVKLLRNNDVVIELLENFSDYELSNLVSDEIMAIMAFLQFNVQTKNEFFKQYDKVRKEVDAIEQKINELDENDTDFLEKNAKLNDEHVLKLSELDKVFDFKQVDVLKSDDKPTINNRIIEIPFVAGNSMSGLIRDLLIEDFFHQVGLIQSYESVPIELYHQLTTGGAITESTAFEDIAFRENFIKMCPPIGLLGTAAGNQTLQSELVVSNLNLLCLENENDDISCQQLLSYTFGTRIDDEKQERNINLSGKMNNKTAQQMFYSHETVITGAKFEGFFKCTSYNDLIKSCFNRALNLLKEHGALGGKTNRGLGQCNFSFENFDDSLYLEHLQVNKDEIFKYFTRKKEKK